MPYYCEICGRPVSRPKVYEVDGATLILCENCAKLTRARRITSAPKMKRITITRPKKLERKQTIPIELRVNLVENYGEKIRQARLAKGLSREKLAKMLSISPSFLKKIEDNEAIPSEEIINRLEKILKIRLREDISTELEILSFDAKLKKPRPLTLADVMIIKPSKKKKKKKSSN